MQRQIIHGKPILLGNLARAPREGFVLVATNRILRLLTPTPADWERRIGLKPARQSWPQALAQLRALEVRYIVIHKEKTPPSEQQEYYRALSSTLKLPIVVDDAELRVYRL